jgi:ABC-type glycerol-3-phosphate transport system permease component
MSAKEKKYHENPKANLRLFLYFVVLMVPIYWMLNMSLRSNADILSTFSLYPANITFENYIKVFTDPDLVFGIYQCHDLRQPEYDHVAGLCPAGRLCLFAVLNFWATARCFSGC